MKNSFNTIISALALVLTLTFSAHAGDKEVKKVTGFNSGVYASKDGKIKVNIDKYNHASTAILFQNSKGKVYYREVTGKYVKQLRREIDITDLPAGDYTLEIVSKGEKQTKEFQLTDKVVERIVKMD